MAGRRDFLKASASLLAAPLFRRDAITAQETAPAARANEPLPPWVPGTLEIHHIDTGRGNACVVIGPDGTSILIDAGEAHSAEKTLSPARPDGSRRAGEAIARYVKRQLKRARRSDLDIAFLTHLHGDHVGEVAPSSPQSARGPYRLTGFADVADAIEVREVLDRGWPDYDYPAPQHDPNALNYTALAKSMASRGTKVQRAQAGSSLQLGLRHDAARYPAFRARVLSVNGNVWSGAGEDSMAHFPSTAGLGPAAMPTENMCCASLVVEYGAFRYFTGGDLPCDTSYGLYQWHDIETPVAQAAGRVSVAVANHHGYFDACGPAFVRALQPRVWVLPTWHVSHPAMNVIANLFSRDLYSGERAVFATGMTPEALLVTERFSSGLASSDGHVVLRVPAGGSTFSVDVVDAHNEAGGVVKSFGPFTA